MACETHSWWFDAPCPQCSGAPVPRPDVTAPVTIPPNVWEKICAVEEIPAFLLRDANNATPSEQRIWTWDSMEWVIAPLNAKVGEIHTWAGKCFKIECADDNTLRVKMLKPS